MHSLLGVTWLTLLLLQQGGYKVHRSDVRMYGRIITGLSLWQDFHGPLALSVPTPSGAYSGF